MKLYLNAKLYQMPEEITAIAVSDGQIRSAGTDADILSSCGSEAEDCIDLGGRLVLPGFVDSHMHLVQDALETSYVNLSPARSLAEAMQLCRNHLPACRKSGIPLRGTGFNQNSWDAPVLPTREDLDKIASDLPIILQRACHHITVCSTRALELFGGLSRFPDGILREKEQEELDLALPPLPKDRIKALIRQETARAAAKGITAIHTDDFMLLPGELYGQTIIQAYRELDAEGLLPIRIVEQCNLSSMDRLQAFLDAGYRTGDNFGNFTIGPLKLLADGALGARTAAMSEDYADDPGNRGILNYDDDSLYELCSLSHKNHMQIAIHGIGDAAIDQILRVYERIQSEVPRPDARHGIVHCQITRPDQLQLMQRLAVLAYVQPAFLRADRHIAEQRIGTCLCESSYAWRTMKDLGIHLSGGSDCPVEPFDVLRSIYYAVQRKDPEAETAWHPENGLHLEEAIDAFTMEGAHAAFAEKKRGKLQPGFAADFCVLDRDITSLPPEELLKARVVLTVCDGQEVYRA